MDRSGMALECGGVGHLLGVFVVQILGNFWPLVKRTTKHFYRPKTDIVLIDNKL